MTDHAIDIDVWLDTDPATSADELVQRAVRQTAGLNRAEAWLERDACGRPVVRGRNDLQVSISHTRGALLVAIARDSRIGVDVEAVCERGLRRLADHALTTAEQVELASHEPSQRLETFLRYWTRKEALLKAAGVGLSVDPSLIALPPSHSSPHPTGVPAALGRCDDWWIVELDLGGHVAAVAIDAPGPRVRVRRSTRPGPPVTFDVVCATG